MNSTAAASHSDDGAAVASSGNGTTIVEALVRCGEALRHDGTADAANANCNAKVAWRSRRRRCSLAARLPCSSAGLTSPETAKERVLERCACPWRMPLPGALGGPTARPRRRPRASPQSPARRIHLTADSLPLDPALGSAGSGGDEQWATRRTRAPRAQCAAGSAPGGELCGAGEPATVP